MNYVNIQLCPIFTDTTVYLVDCSIADFSDGLRLFHGGGWGRSPDDSPIVSEEALAPDRISSFLLTSPSNDRLVLHLRH